MSYRRKMTAFYDTSVRGVKNDPKNGQKWPFFDDFRHFRDPPYKSLIVPYKGPKMGQGGVGVPPLGRKWPPAGAEIMYKN